MFPGMHIDIVDSGEPAPAQDPVGQPWVGIRFECCGVYSRVYRDRDGKAYEGRCPKCLKRVCLRVGPGGTRARFFTAE